MVIKRSKLQYFIAFLEVFFAEAVVIYLSTEITLLKILTNLVFGVCFYYIILVCSNYKSRKLKWLSVAGGMVIATCSVLGYLINRDGITAANVQDIFRNIILIGGATPVCSGGVAIILELLSKKAKDEIIEIDVNNDNSKKIFFLYWGIIFIGFLFIMLSFFPGIVNYDAKYQILQVLTDSYKTNHPLLHTLLLGKLYKLGGSIGSYSIGIMFYTLAQIIILSGAMAYSLKFLYEIKISRPFRIIVCILYIVFPINTILSVSATKDVICGALLLAYVVMLFKCILIKNYLKWNNMISIILTASLMILFRNNLLYAFILTVPALIFCMKKQWVKATIMVLAILMLYTVTNKALINLTDASTGSLTEMISVPIQQMARVGNLEINTLDEIVKEELLYYIPQSVIDQYSPVNADMVKNNIDITKIHGNIFGFLTLWAKIGIAHPITYIDSFLYNTSGYWYLGDSYHAIIYGKGGFLLTDSQSIVDGYTVSTKSYIPVISGIYNSLFSENQYRNIPILWIMFTPAFFLYLIMLYVLFIIYRGKYILLMPAGILLSIYITLLLGPVVLIRYIYGITLCIPTLLGIILMKSKN